VLADLPLEDLELLTANKIQRIYKKGEIIFWEGAYPAGIFYITRGKVKKYKLDKDGREQIIYVANTGELLGYHAILSEDRYPDSAAVLEESTIAFIPKEDFLHTLRHSEVLSKRLLRTLSHEFAVLTNSLSMFAQKSVRQRLALQLIVLREKYKVNFQAGMPVEINMGRDDLANLVGTARENVVRILTEFKEAKILQTKGRKIIIHDVRKLIKIAD
ncbi:MAG: Crp/Fnr family transcriptional regulator, partial [Bacteroidota bacterium]|nr:Crp/Fnr family transcriptional regulator [Bacteroidota bacterium]